MGKETTEAPALNMLPETFPTGKLPLCHINLSAEQRAAISDFPSLSPSQEVGPPVGKAGVGKKLPRLFPSLSIFIKAFIPTTPSKQGPFTAEGVLPQTASPFKLKTHQAGFFNRAHFISAKQERWQSELLSFPGALPLESVNLKEVTHEDPSIIFFKPHLYQSTELT